MTVPLQRDGRTLDGNLRDQWVHGIRSSLKKTGTGCAHSSTVSKVKLNNKFVRAAGLLCSLSGPGGDLTHGLSLRESPMQPLA